MQALAPPDWPCLSTAGCWNEKTPACGIQIIGSRCDRAPNHDVTDDARMAPSKLWIARFPQIDKKKKCAADCRVSRPCAGLLHTVTTAVRQYKTFKVSPGC